MKYAITFARFGYAEVDASSKQEAIEKAEAYGAEDVEWSDQFSTTDVDECNDE